MIEEFFQLILENKPYISRVKIPTIIYNMILEYLIVNHNRTEIEAVRILVCFQSVSTDDYIIIGENNKVISTSSSVKECLICLKRIDSMKVMQ